MRRNHLKLLLLLAFTVTNFVHAHFCAREMAEYFKHPSLTRTLNETVGSRQKLVLLSQFEDDRGIPYAVWLVEETFPFRPGWVSKRVYRHLTHGTAPQRGLEERPLSFRQFAELVKPHATMVETKERARRRWTDEIYDDLSEVTLRFGPDMVTHWIEKQKTHLIGTTLRLTHMPYAIGRDGNLASGGIAVRELYGDVEGYRDPFSPTFNADANWEKVLPPNINPLEHVLKINIRRTGYNYDPRYDPIGLDTEVGAYAVEETLDADLRDAGILEMWLNVTRASTKFSAYGRGFLKVGMRTLSYGDPYSQAVFQHHHGIKRQDHLMIPHLGTRVSDEGEISYANADWRVIGWTGQDLIDENQRILEGRHPRFPAEFSHQRRMSLFIPSRDYDTAVLGAFDPIFDLLNSTDENSFVGALSNLIYNIELLEREKDSQGKVIKLGPRLEKEFDAALLKSVRRRAVYIIDTFDFLVRGMKHFIIPPKTIPHWYVRALMARHLNNERLVVEKALLREEALNSLYAVGAHPRLDWTPDSEEPADPRTAKFEAALLRYFQAQAEVRGNEVYFHELKRTRAGVHLELTNLETVLTDNQLHSAIARVVALFRADAPAPEGK